MESHRTSVAQVGRPDHKQVNTLVLTADEAFRRRYDVARGKAASLTNALRPFYGHKNGYNNIKVFPLWEELARYVIENPDIINRENTFIYVDSRVYKGVPKALRKYIRIKVAVGRDGSMLAAAPISGYSASSQVYSRLAEEAVRLIDYRKTPHHDNRTESEIRKEMAGLARLILSIIQGMSDEAQKISMTDEEITAFIDGLIDLFDKDEATDEFMNKTPAIHHWYPPAQKADWEKLEKYFEHQKRLAEA